MLVGLPVYLQRHLQSAQNAAACLIFRLCRSSHITDVLVSLHWLRVLEYITYKVAILTYCALISDVPRYLRQFVRVADIPSRRRLWWYSTSDDLIIPAVRLTTISCRAFLVARARIWNTLPVHVTSASSLTVFKQRLKLHLFCFSFPVLSPVWLLSGPCSVCCHYKNFDWYIDWLKLLLLWLLLFVVLLGILMSEGWLRGLATLPQGASRSL